MIFRGSEALAAGDLTRGQLRGPRYRALCRDIYIDARARVTHELRCEATVFALPADAAITGRSAATIRGCALARPWDPVEVVAPPRRRLNWRDGIDLRRNEIRRDETEPWNGGRITTPLRMGLDLALDRPLPHAVADLDMVLRAGLVNADELAALMASRSDRGIVVARQAVGLTDPLAESRPESMVRVHLVLAGLAPVPQFWIDDASGRIARTDLAFPEHRLAIEYDGQWRDGQVWALNHDRARLNRVHLAGWDVIFVTDELLANPRKLVAMVEAALRVCAAAR